MTQFNQISNIRLIAKTGYNISKVDAPATADTTFSFTLPIGTRSVLFKSRNAAKLKWAGNAADFISGVYFTLECGNEYKEDTLSLTTALTFYLRSSIANDELEVVYWS